MSTNSIFSDVSTVIHQVEHRVELMQTEPHHTRHSDKASPTPYHFWTSKTCSDSTNSFATGGAENFRENAPQFWVIAVWNQKSLAILSKKIAYLEKDSLRGNFQNFVPKEFIATQIHVLCANFVKFGRPEVGEIARCLPHKNTKIRLARSLSLLRGSRPKSARDSGKQCTHSAPNFNEIRWFPAEL